MNKLEINSELHLKTLELSETKSLFSLVDTNRSHLREWLPWLDYNSSAKDSELFINSTITQAKNNNGLQFGIWFKGELVGVIGQHKVDWPNKFTTIGYWLGAGNEGCGIMTQSCHKLIEYSFLEQKLNRAEIICATPNSKSRAIPERLGFELEGTHRQKEWLYDHFVDHAVYGMCIDKWIVD